MLGLAEASIIGDWKVNRDHEVGDMLGTIPLPEVLKLVLCFYLESGLLKDTNPIQDGKLVYFDGGCGNGALIEWLRRNTDTKPFDQENLRLIDFYGHIGFADRILYDLKELLRSLINPHLTEGERKAVDEFIEIVCTLVLQHAFFYKQSGNIAPKAIGKLAKDPNQIKTIFKDLTKFIPKILNLDSIRADGEFIGDRQFTVSHECRTLLETYFYPKGQQDGTDFMKRYFVPDFETINLAEKIPINFHNVILGRFETIDNQIPIEPLWNIASFCRATSHLPNEEYAKFMEKACRYSKPGGLIIDDGIVESQTRYLRLQEILDIQATLGTEFAFWIIKDKTSHRISLLIQRGLQNSQKPGDYRFFDTKYLNQLIAKRSQIFDIQSFALGQTPTNRVIAHVIHKLKELFTTTPFNGIYLRSTGFQDLHPLIFDTVKRHLPHGELDKTKTEATACNVVNEISLLIPEIRKKIVQSLSI